jgi:hypothetical protein
LAGIPPDDWQFHGCIQFHPSECSILLLFLTTMTLSLLIGQFLAEELCLEESSFLPPARPSLPTLYWGNGTGTV